MRLDYRVLTGPDGRRPGYVEEVTVELSEHVPMGDDQARQWFLESSATCAPPLSQHAIDFMKDAPLYPPHKDHENTWVFSYDY